MSVIRLTPEARPYLRGAIGQHGRVTLPLEIPEAADRPGNAGTLIEIKYKIDAMANVEVQLWIDGVPADRSPRV